KGKKATDVVFSWIIMPFGPNDPWDNTDLVLIQSAGLRDAMGLSKTQLYYKPIELLRNTKLGLLLQDLKNKQEAHEKLNPFYTSVETLENQLTAYHAIRLGEAVRFVPTKNSTAWQSLAQMDDADKARFKSITDAYVAFITAQTKNDSAAEAAADKKVSQAVNDFVAGVRAQYGNYYDQLKLDVEVDYNHLQPFRFAWIFYLLALIFFSFAYFGQWPKWITFAWSATGIALLFHVLGFVSRIYIL